MAAHAKEAARTLDRVNAKAALEGFFGIMSVWEVENETARVLLGAPPVRTFHAWKAGAGVNIPSDTLRRIGYVAGIFKALNILYSPKLADAWAQLPNTNPIFAGESPLAYMRKGGVPSMIRVRQLLDARRGGV